MQTVDLEHITQEQPSQRQSTGQEQDYALVREQQSQENYLNNYDPSEHQYCFMSEGRIIGL